MSSCVCRSRTTAIGENTVGVRFKMRQLVFVPRIVFVTAMVLGLCSAKLGAGETLRLDDRGQWQQPAGSRQEEFLLRVAETKKLVEAGKPKKLRKAAEALKADFPEVAGEDFDVFVAAESLLAARKMTKAVRKYDQLLDKYPASPLRDAAMEREFDIASEFLSGRRKRVLLVFLMRRHSEGIRVMEKLSDRAGTADIARRASLAVAQNYEKRRKYEQAYLKWSEISARWPTGQTGKDALLGMARNKYAAYRGLEYDGSSLISARSYYENFRMRYPEEAKSIKVDEILSDIDEKLADKQLAVARYYSQVGSSSPANLYYQMVVDKWPDSKAAQTARQELSKK